MNLSIAPDSDLVREMASWRHDFHRHPETAYEEKRTADAVARLLGEWGLEVHRGLAGTGVVGVLRGTGGNSRRSVGLRADMDALPVLEKADRSHRSTVEGKMHACGHDGHMAMLLGAAKHLAAKRGFDGTVVFVFQPAEEGGAGALRMMEEGLFERFPVDAVYGLHNWPGLPIGTIATRPGALLASSDSFEITLSGKASHAAMPHLGRDPIIAAAAVVAALQTVVARRVSKVEPAVVSVTQFHAGNAWNVIPEDAVLRGTVRCLSEGARGEIERAIHETVNATAAAHGVTAKVAYRHQYPVLVCSAPEASLAGRAAARVVGADHVDLDAVPTMGSEDFAFFLDRVPGCYVFLGNGRFDEGGVGLHNPLYDFNDAALPVGASYWVSLVETALADPAA